MIKVLVLGEAGTGKTSFIRRYVHEFYTKAYKVTLGVDFVQKYIQYDDETRVRLQLWDIAGQERFGSMTRIYYKDALGAFLVFDLDNPKTFEPIMKWKNDLDRNVRLSDGSPIPCLLLANKCDLVRESDTDKQLLEDFAKQNGLIGCVYTSPKDNINIHTAANMLVRDILRRRRNLEIEDVEKHETIVMTRRLSANKRSCC